MNIFILLLLPINNFKKMSKKSLSWIVIDSIIICAAVLTYNLAIRYELVSIVSTISSGTPLVTVVLALVILKEKLLLNQKIGVSTIILGLILISI